MRRIIKNANLTAIQVTHNQEEAMNVGDRIIIMRDGHILQEDDPELLYNYPNSLFVGNFLGGMNTLKDLFPIEKAMIIIKSICEWEVQN